MSAVIDQRIKKAEDCNLDTRAREGINSEVTLTFKLNQSGHNSSVYDEYQTKSALI